MGLLQLTRYVDGTPTSQVTLVTIRYYPPTHHDHTNQYHGHEWMTHILFVPCQSDVPFHEIRLLQTLTLKLQSQGHGCDQKAKSYSQPSILLTRFLFISHQSDQQFLRYSYFEIWPWNIQGQGHEWGKKVKVTYCTQYPTDALFVSHQSDNHSWDMTKLVFDLEETHTHTHTKKTLKKHIRNF